MPGSLLPAKRGRDSPPADEEGSSSPTRWPSQHASGRASPRGGHPSGGSVAAADAIQDGPHCAAAGVAAEPSIVTGSPGAEVAAAAAGPRPHSPASSSYSAAEMSSDDEEVAQLTPPANAPGAGAACESPPGATPTSKDATCCGGATAMLSDRSVDEAAVADGKRALASAEAAASTENFDRPGSPLMELLVELPARPSALDPNVDVSADDQDGADDLPGLMIGDSGALPSLAKCAEATKQDTIAAEKAAVALDALSDVLKAYLTRPDGAGRDDVAEKANVAAGAVAASSRAREASLREHIAHTNQYVAQLANDRGQDIYDVLAELIFSTHRSAEPSEWSSFRMHLHHVLCDDIVPDVDEESRGQCCRLYDFAIRSAGHLAENAKFCAKRLAHRQCAYAQEAIAAWDDFHREIRNPSWDDLYNLDESHKPRVVAHLYQLRCAEQVFYAAQCAVIDESAAAASVLLQALDWICHYKENHQYNPECVPDYLRVLKDDAACLLKQEVVPVAGSGAGDARELAAQRETAVRRLAGDAKHPTQKYSCLELHDRCCAIREQAQTAQKTAAEQIAVVRACAEAKWRLKIGEECALHALLLAHVAVVSAALHLGSNSNRMAREAVEKAAANTQEVRTIIADARVVLDEAFKVPFLDHAIAAHRLAPPNPPSGAPWAPPDPPPDPELTSNVSEFGFMIRLTCAGSMTDFTEPVMAELVQTMEPTVDRALQDYFPEQVRGFLGLPNLAGGTGVRVERYRHVEAGANHVHIDLYLGAAGMDERKRGTYYAALERMWRPRTYMSEWSAAAVASLELGVSLSSIPLVYYVIPHVAAAATSADATSGGFDEMDTEDHAVTPMPSAMELSDVSDVSANGNTVTPPTPQNPVEGGASGVEGGAAAASDHAEESVEMREADFQYLAVDLYDREDYEDDFDYEQDVVRKIADKLAECLCECDFDVQPGTSAKQMLHKMVELVPSFRSHTDRFLQAVPSYKESLQWYVQWLAGIVDYDRETDMWDKFEVLREFANAFACLRWGFTSVLDQFMQRHTGPGEIAHDTEASPMEADGNSDGATHGTAAHGTSNKATLAGTATPFDWSNHAPTANQELEVRVPRREYDYFRMWGLGDVRATWPHNAGYTPADKQSLLADLQKFYEQPRRVEGDFMVVTETYRPPKSGFPGRLYSPGCQGLVRALRSNILKETADLDMNNAKPRCIVWICGQFGIAAPLFAQYVEHRDGVDGMLQRIMHEARVSKAKAKQLVIITLTDSKPLRTTSTYLRQLDAEAKQIQHALMQRPELQWIKPYCKKENLAGSFLCHLYHFIECRLLLRVQRMLADEFRAAVAALVFDGLNVTGRKWHNNQDILDRAHAVCEEICPGINMLWAWKPLDFVLESKHKVPLTNADGSPKELRAPQQRAQLSSSLAGCVRVKRAREE